MQLQQFVSYRHEIASFEKTQGCLIVYIQTKNIPQVTYFSKVQYHESLNHLHITAVVSLAPRKFVHHNVVPITKLKCTMLSSHHTALRQNLPNKQVTTLLNSHCASCNLYIKHVLHDTKYTGFISKNQLLRNTTFVSKQTFLRINTSDTHHSSTYSHHKANQLKYRHVKLYKYKTSRFNLLTKVALDGIQLLLAKSNHTTVCQPSSHRLRFFMRKHRS